MNLNLGCGEFPLAGYVNVDARPLPGVDLVADVRALPGELPRCEHVYAGHVLEHLPRFEGVTALAHWWSKVATGGDLTVVIPDCRKASERPMPDIWRMVFIGDESSDLTRHYAWWSVEELWLAMSRLPDVARIDYQQYDHRFVADVWWQSAVKVTKR